MALVEWCMNTWWFLHSWQVVYILCSVTFLLLFSFILWWIVTLQQVGVRVNSDSRKRKLRIIFAREKEARKTSECMFVFLCQLMLNRMTASGRQGLCLSPVNYSLPSRGPLSLALSFCVYVCLKWPHTVIALKVNWPQAEHLFFQIDIRG